MFAYTTKRNEMGIFWSVGEFQTMLPSKDPFTLAVSDMSVTSLVISL